MAQATVRVLPEWPSPATWLAHELDGPRGGRSTGLGPRRHPFYRTAQIQGGRVRPPNQLTDARVASEHPDHVALGLEAGEGAGDIRIEAMALQVGEEDVLPALTAAWPGFDAGQVDLLRVEDLEHAAQRAALVAG